MVRKVFISYSRKDRDFVDWLANKFSQQDVDCWYDTSLRGGDDWVETIQMALMECDVQVVVLTPTSANPKSFVKKEYIYAIENDIKIIPIILGSTEKRGAKSSVFLTI